MPSLILKGVRQNNLKDVDIELPLGRTVVLTGPSGSGKSSLAFDTIYAEGQRRYMQSLSTYARQFLEKFRAPLVESIQNIPPTIALEQLNPVRNSRATVGTTTEIYDHLRLLFEKIGIEYCETCDIPMEKLTFGQMFDRLSERFSGQTLLIAFRKKLPREGAVEILKEYLRGGYSRFLLQGKIHSTEEAITGGKWAGKEIALVVDRIRLPKSEPRPEAEGVVAGPPDSTQTRLVEALRGTIELGGGTAEVYTEQSDKKSFTLADTLTDRLRCPRCHRTQVPRSAISFSFNSPLGACETCKGFGNTLEVDPELVIPNPSLSIAQGAIDPFIKPSLRQWQKKLLAFCKTARIDADLPYRDLPPDQKKLVFEGDKRFKGVRGVFDLLEKEKYKMRIRVFVSRYTSAFLCRKCKGSRLNPGGLRVKVGDRNIAEICAMTVEASQRFFETLRLSARERQIVQDVLNQLSRRLDYLNTVGLGYLTLSRLSRSLSGGEYQRILLATQLSTGLTDTMYVLDEPSIGLHPKDTGQLLKVLGRLREQGNSLVVVEHDPEVIEWAEHIVDMGPGSGSRGGSVVFAGSRERFLLSDSTTSRAIREWKAECRRTQGKPLSPDHAQWLEVRSASGNNLKQVDVRVPLQALVAVTGVSGSGKSTLIVDTVYQALAKIFHGRSEKIEKFGSISGFEFLSSVELVDQSPIGKSSRSNPITFIKAYDEIRALFSETREAAAKKLTPGHFSFNVSGGRCDTCEGEGRVKVDMVFMEDIFVPCPTCDGKRFKPHVLSVLYQGKNIDQVLGMTVDDALDFFRDISALRARLAVLHEVGLGYIQLGQPGFTLSGGEAQRLKIAKELSSGSLRRAATLFILDEPTTGLHFNEITRLVAVLRRLVSNGHSVVVIEHNLQMICSAQHVIDLGPDGGEHGGRVVGFGSPKELAQKKLAYTGRYLADILL